MAKITSTVAKYTESHDRLTVNVKFADGTDLRINSSRYRDSLSTKTAGIVHTDLQAIMKFAMAYGTNADGTKENNGERSRRVAKHIEKFNSLHAFAASLV